LGNFKVNPVIPFNIPSPPALPSPKLPPAVSPAPPALTTVPPVLSAPPTPPTPPTPSELTFLQNIKKVSFILSFNYIINTYKKRHF